MSASLRAAAPAASRGRALHRRQLAFACRARDGEKRHSSGLLRLRRTPTLLRQIRFNGDWYFMALSATALPARNNAFAGRRNMPARHGFTRIEVTAHFVFVYVSLIACRIVGDGDHFKTASAHTQRGIKRLHGVIFCTKFADGRIRQQRSARSKLEIAC